MSRELGTKIVDDLVQLPHGHIRKFWDGMSKEDIERLFAGGHHDLDRLIRHLAKDKDPLDIGKHIEAPE